MQIFVLFVCIYVKLYNQTRQIKVFTLHKPNFVWKTAVGEYFLTFSIKKNTNYNMSNYIYSVYIMIYG